MTLPDPRLVISTETSRLQNEISNLRYENEELLDYIKDLEDFITTAFGHDLTGLPENSISRFTERRNR